MRGKVGYKKESGQRIRIEGLAEELYLSPLSIASLYLAVVTGVGRQNLTGVRISLVQLALGDAPDAFRFKLLW